MTGALPAGSHALVIGNGRTGQAAARHLLGLGVAVRLSDARPEARCAAELEGEVEFHAGAESESLLAGITLVVPSPGVRADAPLLRAACAAGIPVLAEIELAAHALNIPLIAISGTNGRCHAARRRPPPLCRW
jgi:UDP-N-acetylmuramoylalanine--D-glutamate ligase